MILAIDPGLSGAFCLLSASDNTIEVLSDLPTIEKKDSKGEKTGRRDIDGHDLALTLSRYAGRIRFCVIEDVSAMTYIDKHGEKRGQGAAASFAFGKSFGVVIGVVSGYMIPIFYLKPAIWKLQMNLSSDKELSRKRATQLFPKDEWRWPLKKHDGRCEALLLAVFGNRKLGGLKL